MAKKESIENTRRIITVIDDYTLFEPNDPQQSDLRIDFPEIKEDDNFNGLTARALRFAWFVANRTSPLIHLIDQKKRIEMAVGAVWGPHWRNNQEAIKTSAGKFSPELKRAIDRMAQFNPSKRLRARLMAEYAFDQVNTMIVASQQDMEDMDFDERKKYTQLLFDTINALPVMVDACERGFGIIIKKTKEGFKTYVTAADISSELAEE